MNRHGNPPLVMSEGVFQEGLTDEGDQLWMWVAPFNGLGSQTEERGSRAQASILHLSLLPESGCSINSCLTLLLPQLPSPPHPCREEPYLQLWAKNKPSPWVAFATYFIPVMRKLINQPLGKIQTSTMRTHPMLQPNRQQVLRESRETKTHTRCGKEVNGVGAVANRSADSPNTNYSYCMTQKFQTYTCAQKK